MKLGGCRLTHPGKCFMNLGAQVLQLLQGCTSPERRDIRQKLLQCSCMVHRAVCRLCTSETQRCMHSTCSRAVSRADAMASSTSDPRTRRFRKRYAELARRRSCDMLDAMTLTAERKAALRLGQRARIRPSQRAVERGVDDGGL